MMSMSDFSKSFQRSVSALCVCALQIKVTSNCSFTQLTLFSGSHDKKKHVRDFLGQMLFKNTKHVSHLFVFSDCTTLPSGGADIPLEQLVVIRASQFVKYIQKTARRNHAVLVCMLRRYTTVLYTASRIPLKYLNPLIEGT